MNRSLAAASSLAIAGVLAVLGTVCGAAGLDHSKAQYTSMAPLKLYLMADRNSEIELARSAAPESISKNATVMVLGEHGYETAVQGKNGFVCLVDRSWMAPAESPDFWNPKIRGPECLNPSAVRSILPITLKRTEMALAHKSKSQIIDGMKEAFAKNQMPPLEPGAMSYMMSKLAYLTDDDDHNMSHLMFYTSRTDPADWGADLPHYPLTLVQFKGSQPIDVLLVPMGKWSDGTPAPGE